MASVFDFDPAKQIRVPPVMGFRGRAAELDLHAAFLKVADKVPLGIARRDVRSAL